MIPNSLSWAELPTIRSDFLGTYQVCPRIARVMRHPRLVPVPHCPFTLNSFPFVLSKYHIYILIINATSKMRWFKFCWKMKLIWSQFCNSFSNKFSAWFNWLAEQNCSAVSLNKWSVSKCNVISHSSLLDTKSATCSTSLVLFFSAYSASLIKQNKCIFSQFVSMLETGKDEHPSVCHGYLQSKYFIWHCRNN